MRSRLLLLALGLAASPALAAPLDPALLVGLAAEDSEQKLAAIRALTRAGGTRGAAVLSALWPTTACRSPATGS